MRPLHAQRFAVLAGAVQGPRDLSVPGAVGLGGLGGLFG